MMRIIWNNWNNYINRSCTGFLFSQGLIVIMATNQLSNPVNNKPANKPANQNNKQPSNNSSKHSNNSSKKSNKSLNQNNKNNNTPPNEIERFTNDIYGIYDLINGKGGSNNTKNPAGKLFNVSILSKQYLAYYLYRIFTKFISLFENAIPSKDLKELMKYLRIPADHDRLKPYPLAGRMTNDERLLDLIILLQIEMLNNVNKYIQGLPNDSGYGNFFNFLESKTLNVIIEDLVDLQKLIPGLSVSAVRFNYFDNRNI